MSDGLLTVLLSTVWLLGCSLYLLCFTIHLVYTLLVFGCGSIEGYFLFIEFVSEICHPRFWGSIGREWPDP